MQVGITRFCSVLFLNLCAAAGFAQPEQFDEGHLSGLIGETALDLEGAEAFVKPDSYSDLCTLAVTTEVLSPMRIDFVFLVPCGDVESLVGRDYVPSGSEVEYVRVSSDFEFDQQNTGGRYQTRWEAAGIRAQEFEILLTLTDFDGEYLSGELVSELPLTWVGGALPTTSRTDRLHAVFQARVESSGQ